MRILHKKMTFNSKSDWIWSFVFMRLKVNRMSERERYCLLAVWMPTKNSAWMMIFQQSKRSLFLYCWTSPPISQVAWELIDLHDLLQKSIIHPSLTVIHCTVHPLKCPCWKRTGRQKKWLNTFDVRSVEIPQTANFSIER